MSFETAQAIFWALVTLSAGYVFVKAGRDDEGEGN